MYNLWKAVVEGKCGKYLIHFNKTICGSTGMEAGFASKKAFVRCEQSESDTYYRTSAFFDAVPAGNGSASAV